MSTGIWAISPGSILVVVSRVHHALSNYRLSCNCIQSYSSVQQTGIVPKAAVLCSNCGGNAYILERYPPDTCGEMCRADNPEGGVIKVRCSKKPHPGNDHYDCTVGVQFRMPPKLRAGKQGNT